MDDLLLLLFMILGGLLVAGIYYWFFVPKELYKLSVKLGNIFLIIISFILGHQE